MLRFVMTPGHEYTLAKARKMAGVSPFEILSYDRLIAARRLPRAVYVLTDFDRLGGWDLELAAIIARELRHAGVPVLNDPARFATRYGLLRALHEAGLNQFNAYRVEERVRPDRYPVFLRREIGHRAPLSDLLDDWDAARRAIDAAIADGVPTSQLLLIEYAGEAAAPGIFRKLSVARLGERYVAQLCGHDDQWLVKRGKIGSATPELYEDEHRIVRDNPFAEDVAPAFELAGIDYGRVDFGLVGGRVQIYEVNTNPHVPTAFRHPVPLRMETQRLAWEQFREALGALSARAPGGGQIRLTDRRLTRYHGRSLRPVRSRPVP